MVDSSKGIFFSFPLDKSDPSPSTGGGVEAVGTMPPAGGEPLTLGTCNYPYGGIGTKPHLHNSSCRNWRPVEPTQATPLKHSIEYVASIIRDVGHGKMRIVQALRSLGVEPIRGWHEPLAARCAAYVTHSHVRNGICDEIIWNDGAIMCRPGTLPLPTGAAILEAWADTEQRLKDNPPTNPLTDAPERSRAAKSCATCSTITTRSASAASRTTRPWT